MRRAEWRQRIGASIVDYCLFLSVFWYLQDRWGFMVPFTILIAYQTMALRTWGATLGKGLFELSVRRLDGDSLGVREALLRSAVYTVTLVLAGKLFFFIGPLGLLAVALSNERRQCLHDIASGTWVMKAGASAQGLGPSVTRSLGWTLAVLLILACIAAGVFVIYLGVMMGRSPTGGMAH